MIGRRHVLIDDLEAHGFIPVLAIGLLARPDGSLIPRLTCTPNLAQVMHEHEAVRDAIRHIIGQLEELGKPLDDRKLDPATTVEVDLGGGGA